MGKRKGSAVADTVSQVILELPLGQPDPPGHQAIKAEQGYISERGMHIDVRLGAKAATAFARLRNGLRESGARLSTGRPVWTGADALRYLLETLADAGASDAMAPEEGDDPPE